MAGERAIRECIDEGRAIADKCSGPERSAIVQLCDELDQLTDEIANMMKRGKVSDCVVRMETNSKAKIMIMMTNLHAILSILTLGPWI